MLYVLSIKQVVFLAVELVREARRKLWTCKDHPCGPVTKICVAKKEQWLSVVEYL